MPTDCLNKLTTSKDCPSPAESPVDKVDRYLWNDQHEDKEPTPKLVSSQRASVSVVEPVEEDRSHVMFRKITMDVLKTTMDALEEVADFCVEKLYDSITTETMIVEKFASLAREILDGDDSDSEDELWFHLMAVLQYSYRLTIVRLDYHQ